MRAPGACFASLLVLTGCLGGGGGGGGGVDGGGGGGAGGSTPSLAQLDLPLGADPASFETPEYRRSRALEPIGASTLYAAGGTGAGVTVGIIDTGIDQSHPEFAGAIHPASRDLVRGGALEDGSGHGTAVAGLIGARQNGSATHGVAFAAELLAIRADDAGSCAAACTFDQDDLAAATDYAVANGAKVLNFSLGTETGLASSLRRALGDAAAADRVLVLAAGNGGAASPGNPGGFVTSGAARGAAIVVGALGTDGEIAAFSNRAGAAAEAFLVAPGSSLITTAEGGGGAVFTGTSAATPLVAGAAAALAGAAPHLSAAEITSILLDSARDLGDPGTDPVYGRGALDLQQALLPAGPLSVPEGVSTNQTGQPLSATSLAMGGAFGAVAPALGPVMALDSYARPYAVQLETRAASRADEALPALLRRQLAPEVRSAESGGITLGLTETDRLSPVALAAAPDLAGLAFDYRAADESWRIEARLGEAAAGGAGRGDGLLRARRWLEAPTHFADLAAPLGIAAETVLAGSWRLSLGLAGDPGGALDSFGGLGETDSYASRPLPEGRLAALGLEHRSTDGRRFRLGFGQLEEADGPLGSTGSGALAAGAAVTRYVDVEGSLPLAAGWRAFGEAAIGRTDAAAGKGGLVAEVGPLWTTAFSLGVAGEGVWREADRLTLTLRQPLRVERGQATFAVPVARDIAGTIRRERRAVDLDPAGRELNLELGYGLDLGPARLRTALMLRHAPGHAADAPPELLGVTALELAF